MKKPLQFPVTTVLILCSVVTFKMHHLIQDTDQSFIRLCTGCQSKNFVSWIKLKNGYLSPQLLHPPGPQPAFVLPQAPQSPHLG